jgi:hypothetical protein
MPRLRTESPIQGTDLRQILPIFMAQMPTRVSPSSQEEKKIRMFRNTMSDGAAFPPARTRR